MRVVSISKIQSKYIAERNEINEKWREKRANMLRA